MRALSVIVLAGLPVPSFAQPAEEEALIRSVFDEINPVSIAESREYCGYVGFDAGGNLIASDPRPGTEDECTPEDPVDIEVITASYHTHGSFSTDYASEVPSGEDMEGDEAEGIDGWVATPGGRLWLIDTEDMVTWQVCGIGCLPADPSFIRGDMGPIAEEYSYDDLVIRLAE